MNKEAADRVFDQWWEGVSTSVNPKEDPEDAQEELWKEKHEYREMIFGLIENYIEEAEKK